MIHVCGVCCRPPPDGRYRGSSQLSVVPISIPPTTPKSICRCVFHCGTGPNMCHLRDTARPIRMVYLFQVRSVFRNRGAPKSGRCPKRCFRTARLLRTENYIVDSRRNSSNATKKRGRPDMRRPQGTRIMGGSTLTGLLRLVRLLRRDQRLAREKGLDVLLQRLC